MNQQQINDLYAEWLKKPQRKLTVERLKEMLHYDKETGVFTWKFGRKGVAAGMVAGTVHTTPCGHRYRSIMIDGVRHRASHLAFLYVHGSPAFPTIDHKNQDPLDNRIHNLRVATHSQQQRNSPQYRTNTTGVAGVTWNKARGKFVAQIRKKRQENIPRLLRLQTRRWSCLRASQGTTGLSPKSRQTPNRKLRINQVTNKHRILDQNNSNTISSCSIQTDISLENDCILIGFENGACIRT